MTRTEIDNRLWSITEAFFPGVGRHAVLGRGKAAHVVAARHFWWALQFAHGRTMSGIARKEGRNHTSVMYGIRKAEREWGQPRFAELLNFESARVEVSA